MKYKQEEMKKKTILSVSIIVILVICVFGYLYIYKPYADEKNKISAFCDYLSQYHQEIFVTDIGMDSAEATVEYHEELNQYSISISLESSEAVSEEQLASCRAVLEKQFQEITLIVNGEVR